MHTVLCFSRAYSAEEEKLFLEGLDLFGRNWKQARRSAQCVCGKESKSSSVW